MEADAAAARGREAEIEKAIRARVPDLKKQADSLTLEGVRRALEKDMGLEIYSLDAHKKFIKQCVDKVFSGSDDENTNNNVSEKAETKDDHSSKEGSEDAQPVSGSNKISPSAYEQGARSSETEKDPEGQEEASGSDISEAMIKKAIDRRASYFRENSEMSGQTNDGLGQQAGWDENLRGPNCPDKTRKRLRSGKSYGSWSRYPKKRRILPICYRCGKEGHFAVGCQLGRVKVCQRCGEEGHYSDQCTSACPNCDRDHLPGNCPTAKVTCFLCEGNDHYPKECGLNQAIAKSVELQQRILRASVSLATTDAAKQEKFLDGLSEELQDKIAVYGFPNFQALVDNTIVARSKERALKELREHQKKAQGGLRHRAEVTCFFCQLKGHYANNCPKRVAATPRPPQAVSPPRAPTSQPGGLRDVAEVTCFYCRMKGHYANNCPVKNQDKKDHRGQVNSLSAKEAQEAPDVVLGSEEFVEPESDPLQQTSDLHQEEVDPQGINFRETDFDFNFDD